MQTLEIRFPGYLDDEWLDWCGGVEETDKIDEQMMIRAARKGSVDAFNALVLLYQDLLYASAFRILGDHSCAEDAVQEALLTAYQKLNSYRGGSFRAWLLRITSNLCLDELRRVKRRPSIPLEPVSDDGEEWGSSSWMADPGPYPEEVVEQRQLNAVLLKALLSLPQEMRLVLVLVDLQGLDYLEAAQVIGIPVGTVKSRLARARVRVRNELLKGAVVDGIPITTVTYAAQAAGQWFPEMALDLVNYANPPLEP